MKVYKYRGGNDEILERDLDTLKQNYFWGARYDLLNDPYEAEISMHRFRYSMNKINKLVDANLKDVTHELFQLINEIKDKGKTIGIYSLSQTYDHPLLWSHYGNMHKGFCVEFDLDILLNTYLKDEINSFEVIYSDTLPEFSLLDIINADKKDKNYLAQRLYGKKSIEWEYEKEYRIIIDQFGKHVYDYRALKAIYFGLNMDNKWKNKIMKTLKGRGIQYYQMDKSKLSYKFVRKKVEDICTSEITYLCQIPNLDIGITKYKILDKHFNKFKEKATITIELEKKVDKKELTWLSKVVKCDLFSTAKRIFLSFYIKDYLYDIGYWAVSQFVEEEFEVKINGLTIQEEKKLKTKLTFEKRDVIGMWIDDRPFMGAALILLKDVDGKYSLESHFIKRDISIRKYKAYKFENEIRYKDALNDSTKEYFVINKKGILHYYSGDKMFMELQPFKT